MSLLYIKASFHRMLQSGIRPKGCDGSITCIAYLTKEVRNKEPSEQMQDSNRLPLPEFEPVTS